MSWYSKSEKIILDSMALGRPATDMERVRQADKAIGYYQNRSGYQVQDLSASYVKQFKDPDTWAAIPKVSYNLVRPVADTLSKIYSYPVTRIFKDQAHGAIIGADFNSMMALVDLYTLISGTVAVRPIWDPIAEAITYAVYYGNEIDCTPDPQDPSRIMQLRLSWKYGGNTIEHIWEADRFAETVEGKEITEEDAKVNGYGRIPVVIFTNSYMTKAVLDYPASDLVEGNRTLNWLITIVNDCIPIQIAGLLVTKGAKDGLNIRVGQRARLELPADPEANAFYINPGADIEKGLSAVNLNMELFFSQRNIPESAIRATQLSGKSGLAFIAEQEALTSYYKGRQALFGKKDAELCALAVAVAGYHKTKAFKIPDLPQIKYYEFKQPMSADERALWDWEILNGIATPVDLLMAKHNGMSQEEAIKKLQDNKALEYKSYAPDLEDQAQAAGPAKAAPAAK